MHSTWSSSPSEYNPSPKRKRADSSSAGSGSCAPELVIPTAHIYRASPTPESPRSQVAQGLSDLRLKEYDDGVKILDFGTRAGSDPVRKRLKHEGGMPLGQPRQLEDTSMLEVPETPQTHHRDSAHKNLGMIMKEIPETPQISFTKEGTAEQTRMSPVSRLAPDPDKLVPVSIPPSNTPPPKQRSPSPIAPSLNTFWQDSEITGHLGDDSDDDGVGINGIGFKPTPAIAHARTQRRRQQVTDWRAREAREARQKRSERRRGGSLRPRHDTEETKRTVRFA